MDSLPRVCLRHRRIQAVCRSAGQLDNALTLPQDFGAEYPPRTRAVEAGSGGRRARQGRRQARIQLRFENDVARMQRALAQCHDLVARRTAVHAALNLRSGERVLELGCGGGDYTYEAAQFVGPAGRLCVFDVSGS